MECLSDNYNKFKIFFAVLFGVMHFPYSAPTPKNTVNANKVKHAEFPIEGSILYRPLPSSIDISKQIFTSLSSRFSYAINNASAWYPSETQDILVLDLFLGTGKIMSPDKQHDVATIWTCIYLSSNRAFLIYETLSNSKQASVIWIDFERGIYGMVGTSYNLTFSSIGWYYNIPSAEPLVLFKTLGSDAEEQLHIFEFDGSSFDVTLRREVPVPMNSFLFHSTNGHLVFTQLRCKDMEKIIIGNFARIEPNNSFTEIENTEVEINLSKPKSELPHLSISMVETSWHNSKAFLFINLVHVKQLKNRHTYPVISTPIVFTFDLDEKLWSEIRCLSFPLNRAYYQFHVDEKALLTVITYSEAKSNSEETRAFRVMSLRIPLKCPDNLFNLCWFKTREYKLESTLKSLIT